MVDGDWVEIEAQSRGESRWSVGRWTSSQERMGSPEEDVANVEDKRRVAAAGFAGVVMGVTEEWVSERTEGVDCKEMESLEED